MKLIHTLLFKIRFWLCEDLIADAMVDAIGPEGWLWEEQEIGGIVIDLAFEKGYDKGFHDGHIQGYKDSKVMGYN